MPSTGGNILSSGPVACSVVMKKSLLFPGMEFARASDIGQAHVNTAQVYSRRGKGGHHDCA